MVEDDFIWGFSLQKYEYRRGLGISSRDAYLVQITPSATSETMSFQSRPVFRVPVQYASLLPGIL
jgi:hypothetical protein